MCIGVYCMCIDAHRLASVLIDTNTYQSHIDIHQHTSTHTYQHTRTRIDTGLYAFVQPYFAVSIAVCIGTCWAAFHPTQLPRVPYGDNEMTEREKQIVLGLVAVFVLWSTSTLGTCVFADACRCVIVSTFLSLSLSLSHSLPLCMRKRVPVYLSLFVSVGSLLWVLGIPSALCLAHACVHKRSTGSRVRGGMREMLKKVL